MSEFIRFAAGVITGVLAIKLIKHKKTEPDAAIEPEEPAVEKKTPPRRNAPKTTTKQKKVDGGEEQAS